MKLIQNWFVAVVVIVCVGFISFAHAQGINNLVVYIECTKDGQPTSRGSGVLVSEKGHVLTAGHVVPDGYNCKGIQENPTLPTRKLIRDPRTMSNVDATLLRFTPKEGEKFPSAKYCKLDDTFKAKSIKARGFHQNSDELTIRAGVISTIHPNENGIIETDVHTVRGMSGGAVMLGDSSNLIGIIAGAKFDKGTSQPIYFGVLAAEVIANTFQLIEDAHCTKNSNARISETEKFVQLKKEILQAPTFDKSVQEKIDQIIEIAEKGSGETQYILGMMYHAQKSKMGVKRMNKESLYWLEKSAKRGYVEAQYQLGYMYLDGRGVNENFENGFGWTLKAAENGDKYAQHTMGEVFETDSKYSEPLKRLGLYSDDVKAFKWYQKAALQGLTDAQWRLAEMYCMGKGITKNKAKAKEWRRLSLELNRASEETIQFELKDYDHC